VGHRPRAVGGRGGGHGGGIEAGRVAIWASELDAPARASIESAQRHHAVVEAAMKLVTPVPLGFGQWLPDEEAVRLRAMARAADWEAQLAALRGTAEYTVRVLDPAVDAPARD